MNRSRPAGTAATSALAIGLALGGCGGARAPVEAPRSVQPPAPADVRGLPILLQPPPPAVLAPFAVNPTVAVSARPGVVVAPVADGMAFQRAVEALDGGTLPAPPPEVFVDAVADDGPGALLRAEWAASPYRPGYHGLRLVIAPAPAEPPPAAVIVLEARRDLLDDAGRAALRRLGQRAAAQRLGLVVAGEAPEWHIAPESMDAPRWAKAVDALELSGPADLGAAVAAARAALPADGLVLVVASAGRALPSGPLPVARLAPRADLARALPEALARRPVISDARLSISFDERHVERYRLVGFDGGGAGGRAAVLWSGRATAILVEIKLRPERPAGALGTLRLSGLDDRGEPVDYSGAIAPVEASGRVGAALLAAAVAEKLRQAWWSRGMGWARLADDAERLAAQPGARLLARIIDQAARLDARADRFADHGAIDAMDPDSVPILRGAR